MKNNSGQALVLVLLSLSVVLTLVLYILSRSVVDISTSSRDEESVRAFSAAEAGVEKALVIGSTIGQTNLSDASYSANVDDVSEGLTTYNYPIELYAGETGTIWYVAHDEEGNKICDAGAGKPCYAGSSMKFCWGRKGATAETSPAVEISIFYNNKIARAVFDPNVGRTSNNNFSLASSADCEIDSKLYEFSADVDFSDLGIVGAQTPGVLQFARVRFLYNSTEKHGLGVISDNPLPSQGMMVNSTGVSGDSNRRLEVFQGYPEAPSVLDYSIFSSSGLVKGN